MEGMTKEAVWQMVQQLQAGLQAREKQLERQGQQLASMQEVQHQLQVNPHAPMQPICSGHSMRWSPCKPAIGCGCPCQH